MIGAGAAFAAGILLSLSGCGEFIGDGTAIASENPIDPGVVREKVVGDLSSQTFEDVGDNAACTDDCSGHNAGFEWAKDHDIDDESECRGNSASFIEGCQTYEQTVEEKVDEERTKAEEGEASDS